jgi:hypothetical protein
MVAAEIEQQRTLIVPAVQDGWVMGEDLVLQVTGKNLRRHAWYSVTLSTVH